MEDKHACYRRYEEVTRNRRVVLQICENQHNVRNSFVTNDGNNKISSFFFKKAAYFYFSMVAKSVRIYLMYIVLI